MVSSQFRFGICTILPDVANCSAARGDWVHARENARKRGQTTFFMNLIHFR